jgi:hypothetical protein
MRLSLWTAPALSTGSPSLERVGGRLAGALTFRFDDGTVVLPLDVLWSTTP